MTYRKDAEHVGEHHVYRLFDKHDELIYIGMTSDVLMRMDHHRNHFINPWALYVDHWTSEAYPDRVSARAAEQAAIAEAEPPFNKNHSRHRSDPQHAESYKARWAEKEPPPDPELAATLAALFAPKDTAASAPRPA